MDVLAYVYSSDDDKWSDSISTQLPLFSVNSPAPIVLMGNALYFMLQMHNKILKCDLEMREIPLIQLPHACSCSGVTTTEDGGLGFATVRQSKLYVWLRKVTPEGDGGWVQSRIVELEMLLPVDALWTSFGVVGFADGIGVIFLRGANNALFTIDLKTYKVRKVCKERNIYSIVPYMSFYSPAIEAACTSEGPSTGVSSE